MNAPDVNLDFTEQAVFSLRALYNRYGSGDHYLSKRGTAFRGALLYLRDRRRDIDLLQRLAAGERSSGNRLYSLGNDYRLKASAILEGILSEIDKRFRKLNVNERVTALEYSIAYRDDTVEHIDIFNAVTVTEGSVAYSENLLLTVINADVYVTSQILKAAEYLAIIAVLL